MSIKIELPAEIVRQLAQDSARQGKTPEELVTEILTERLATRPKPKKLSSEEFDKLLQEIIDLHPQVSHVVDDSRDSIYEGRGE